jgi:hypothetical protein
VVLHGNSSSSLGSFRLQTLTHCSVQQADVEEEFVGKKHPGGSQEECAQQQTPLCLRHCGT